MQCFIKLDTLAGLCESLLRCEGRQAYDLVFWMDGLERSRQKELDYEKREKVGEYIRKFKDEFSADFASIQFYDNLVNLGTCKTCALAIDNILKTHEYIIFTEDDTIFAPDALLWFATMRDTEAFADADIWAIAGESVFFDAKEKGIPSELLEQARTYALSEGLWNKYLRLNFLPSTCFATTRQKWAEFGATRGQPLGDVDVCDRCVAEAKYAIFPVIGRVKDVGMLHPDGYSVRIHSAAGVRSIKNTYLLSGDLLSERVGDLVPEPYIGNRDLLYWMSSLLNGFQHDAHSDTKARDLTQQAREASQNGDWHKSLELWQRVAASTSSPSAEASTFQALASLKLGRIADAEIHVDAALRLDGEAGFALSIRAYVDEARGRTEAAIEIWRRLQATPDIPDWLRQNAIAGLRRCLGDRGGS